MNGLRCVCITLAVLIITTGCVKTPDETIVIRKKDIEQVVRDKETIDNEHNVDSELIHYDWPKMYINELDELSNFSINADIITSDAKYYPVNKAKQAAYPTSLVDTIIDQFADGAMLFNYLEAVNTKEAIEEQIIIQKRLINDVQSGRNQAYVGTVDHLENYLNELEIKLESAPSQTTLNPVNIHAELDNTGGLQLVSLNGTKMEFIIANQSFRFIRFYTQPCLDIMALKKEDAIDAVGISRLDAERQAYDIVHSLGYLDMSLSEVSVGISLANYSDNNNDYEYSVYYFYFTRSFANTGINYEATDVASFPSFDREDSVYSEPWPYEFISIAIGQNGPQEIIINGNLEITTSVTDNVKLLDFNEMIKKAIPAIKHKYIYADAQHEEEFKYTIDKIKLGYMQVVSLDNPNEFIIVPVWDFFGFESINDAIMLRKHHSYLTINAIDGSIIDRVNGY